jgi:hypothetical protein
MTSIDETYRELLTRLGKQTVEVTVKQWGPIIVHMGADELLKYMIDKGFEMEDKVYS